MTRTLQRGRLRGTTTGSGTQPVRLPRWAWIVALLVIAGLAFFVRYRLLVQAGGLLGSDAYDDGVYYASAAALVHGRLPYLDFLLLQPPGTVVALTPFAWLGSVTSDPTGEIAARLAFIGVGAVNAVLVTLIARRFGITAALLGGIGYAVFFPAAYAERSTLLEPLGTTGLLVAVLLAWRASRHPRIALLVAGAAAGVAIGMRIWYIVPVAVIAVAVAIPRPRALLPYVGGVAVSGLAVYLPFFIAAPADMLREVVLDQLGRPRSTSGGWQPRINTIVGARPLHLQAPWSSLLTVEHLGQVLGIATIVLLVAACTVRGARLFPILSVTTAVVLVASPSFFLHYASFAAPWLVLTAAIGAARLLALLRPRGVRVAIGALLLLAVVGVDLRAAQVARPSSPIPAAALRPAAQQVRGCVQSDDPQILVALDVLSRNLRLGCEVWPDVTGYTYDRDAASVDGRTVPRPQNERWQASVTRYLLSGDAVIVHRAGTGLSATSNRLVRSGPVLARSGNWTLHAVRR